jgi:hypothetical protein
VNRFQIPLVLSLLAACSSPERAEVTEARRRSASTEVPTVTVASVTCEAGPFCAPGSTAVDLEGDHFQLDFSSAIVESDETSTGFGEVDVDFDVPSGFQFSPGHYFAGVAADRADPATGVVLERRYTFDGTSDTRSFSTEVAEGSGRLQDSPEQFWSPCSEDQHAVRLRVRLGATVDGHGSFALESFAGNFHRLEGVQWRRCGDSDPIPEPAGDEGAPCGGGTRLVCRAPLACELGEHSDSGTCVDPAEVLEPQPIHEPCGGVRAIRCQADLVCHYNEPDSAGLGKLGRCARPVGLEKDVCSGHPDIPCADGLACFPVVGASICERIDGELDARCGDDLPPCKEGLECGGERCRHPLAQEGEPCGGPEKIECATRAGHRLQCIDGICQRESPAPASQRR